MPGVHNVSDATAAAAACIENGMSVYSVKAGLRNFKGTKGGLNTAEPVSTGLRL